MRPQRRLARGAVLPAAALALAAAVSGCKGRWRCPRKAPRRRASAATRGARPRRRPIRRAAAAASQATAAGTGSLSVSVTSPVTLSGTAAVPVSCVTGLELPRRGHQRRHPRRPGVVYGRDRALPGPGSYPAVVAVTLRQSTGVVTTVAGVSRVPAAITATGGSFSVSATGSGGRTFTGSLNWTCGT